MSAQPLVSSQSYDVLGEVMAAVGRAGSAEELDSLLLEAAEQAGYVSRIDVPWSYWHYGKHSQVAEQLGMPDLATLFEEGWRAELGLMIRQDRERMR